MTQLQIDTEKKRISILTEVLFWVEEARIKIGVQQFNLSSSNISGEGVRYSDRIEILESSINRLQNRYFAVLNG